MGWLKSAAKYLLLLMLAGLGALVIAVLIAMASLPGFDELKSSPNGQMVRVRAADGSVIVSLGPSYGDWLTGDQIPESMKTAIVAVEDRRFYMHPGIDPVGIARTIWVAKRLHDEGRRLQGRVDDHPAAGAQPVPHQRLQRRPQAARSGAGAGDGAQILEGADPRTLSEPRLFRRRCLWRRRGKPQILRPSGQQDEHG